MLDSEIERISERRKITVLRQMLNDVSIHQLREKGVTCLTSVLQKEYKQACLLWGTDLVAV